jgi:hypothetical protein
VADLSETLEGFEWDAGNSEKNWKRHQVTQIECEQVFANLPLLLAVATRPPTVEPRYFALGRTDLSRDLTVVFTTRGNKVRVISARPMSRRERKEYANARDAAEAEEADS